MHLPIGGRYFRIGGQKPSHCLWPFVFFCFSCLILPLLCLFCCTLSLSASEVEITGNFLEYDEASKFMIATGSVTVTWQDKVLKAKEVRFWIDKKYLTAEGNVVMTEKKSIMFADRMSFDYRTSTGDVVNMTGYSEPWYFHATSAKRTSEDRYEVEGMNLTTCNLPDPHYYIRAKRAKIVIDKRVTVYNAVFYVHHVPLFYLPVWSQGMGHRFASLQIQPGYNSEDGLFVRTIYGVPISKNAYGKLYVDFFSKRGIGTGAELNYNSGSNVKGTLYGYHIKDESAGDERWTLRGSHWQKLDPLWTAQAEVDYVSDTAFNNTYYLEDWQRTAQQLHSFVTFTRQSKVSNLRLIAERYDVYNSSTGVYDPQTITAPRLEYTLYPLRTKLPFYTNLSMAIQNQYISANGYYLQSANIDSNITKDYRIGRDLTLKPQLGIRENWQDKTSATDFSDNFVTRYYANLNARYRVARWMDWDLGYNYLQRSQVNSLLPDFDALDYGEETNQIYYVNSMYLRHNIVIRNSTGYNLHVNRDELLDTWLRKFNPLVNELTWTPPLGFYIYLRQENTIYPYSFNSLQSDSRWGRDDDKYFSFGVFYQAARPDELDFNTGIGFWPTKKWKIDYLLHASEINNFSTFTGNDQEIRLYRDLHCWEFKLTFRQRPNVQEFSFLIDLKSSAKNRDVLFPRNQEREFYPWR